MFAVFSVIRFGVELKLLYYPSGLFTFPCDAKLTIPSVSASFPNFNAEPLLLKLAETGVIISPILVLSVLSPIFLVSSYSALLRSP